MEYFMTKKIVSLLLVCLIFAGCGKAAADPAGNTVPVSRETQIGNTENTTETTTEMTNGTVSATDAASSATVGADTEEITSSVQNLPQPVSYWNPICNEYITLFDSAGGKAVGQIPKGATIGLVNWDGRFARVVYNGQVGYVYSNCLKPVDEDYFANYLEILTPTTKYTYAQMQADMQKMQALYPQQITLFSIGKTAMNRDISLMLVGDPNAKYQILVQAAMHGREHFTAWIAMAMVDAMLKLGKLPRDVCYHIIPMSNPDGVTISQTGQLDEIQMSIYESDVQYGYASGGNLTEYATQWKANALGVDVNRNFVVGWDGSDERPQPSCQRYRGSVPFSTPEALFLCEYTLAHTFHATLSLHSHGSVLYYQYGTKQPVNRLSHSLAKAVQDVTGYVPTAYDNTTGAGYKDWVMDELGIPSLTVEIGSSATPIVQQDMYNTFDRCREMLPAVYHWLTEN